TVLSLNHMTEPLDSWQLSNRLTHENPAVVPRRTTRDGWGRGGARPRRAKVNFSFFVARRTTEKNPLGICFFRVSVSMSPRARSAREHSSRLEANEARGNAHDSRGDRDGGCADMLGPHKSLAAWRRRPADTPGDHRSWTARRDRRIRDGWFKVR